MRKIIQSTLPKQPVTGISANPTQSPSCSSSLFFHSVELVFSAYLLSQRKSCHNKLSTGTSRRRKRQRQSNRLLSTMVWNLDDVKLFGMHDPLSGLGGKDAESVAPSMRKGGISSSKHAKEQDALALSYPLLFMEIQREKFHSLQKQSHPSKQQ